MEPLVQFQKLRALRVMADTIRRAGGRLSRETAERMVRRLGYRPWVVGTRQSISRTRRHGGAGISRAHILDQYIFSRVYVRLAAGGNPGGRRPVHAAHYCDDTPAR